jgi:glycosyltransferase involved in cell wall biosynthesis
MSGPLVSIVTPVHNGGEYVAECIESILGQTYRTWDYSVLDNCSTDGTADIVRRFAAKDSRIRLYRNRQLLPPLANHNAALRLISPESVYCKVVFADDWIFPDCLTRMVMLAESNPSVGLVGAYCLKETRVSCDGLPHSSSVVDGIEICRKHLLDDVYVFGSANSLLYRAELVRNRDPFFDESNIHADTEVCFDLLRTHDFAFVHQVLTFSRMQAGSQRTVSEDLGTDYSGMLRLLVRHGSYFLNQAELERRLARHVTDYYLFLARNLVNRWRDRSFWAFHENALTEAEIEFRRTRLAKALVARLIHAACTYVARTALRFG